MARRAFFLIVVHSLLVQAVSFVLRPTISYRALDLGLSVGWLGAVAACYAVVPLFLAVPIGRLTDGRGERLPLVGGALLLIASALVLLATGDALVGLVAGSAVLGAGHLLSMVGEQTMLANATESGRDRDRVFGHYALGAAMGQTLGPALVAIFGGSETIPDTGRIFLATTVLCGLVLVITVAIRAPSTPAHTSAGAGGAAVRTILATPGVARALSAGVSVLVAIDIITVYLPALGAERGLDSTVVGLLLMLRSGASMASRFFLGALVGGLGRRRILLWSVALAGAAVALMPVPLPVVVLALMVACAGFGLGVGQPILMSWLADAAPAGLRGTAMSLRLTGNRLGQTVMPAVVGLIAAGAGTAGVLWATAAMLAAAGMAVLGTPDDAR